MDHQILSMDPWIYIQLNPALTDFKGLICYICYRRNFVITNTGNERKLVEGIMNLHLLQAEFRGWLVRQSVVLLYPAIMDVKGPTYFYVKWILISIIASKRNNKAEYTATDVACGWAGAMMKHANSYIWAGAIMQKTLKNCKHATRNQQHEGTKIPKLL